MVSHGALETFQEEHAMKIKRLLSLLLAALMLTTMLAACGGDEEDNGPIIEMYYGSTRPLDLDPTTIAVNSDKYQITSLIFEGLTAIDANGKVTPAGATEWEYGIDERDQTLKLTIELKNTNWSDSTPVFADDYIFAWRRLLSPSNTNPAAALLYPIKNARKVKSNDGATVSDIGAYAINETTLEITFEEGFTDVEYFLECLASPALVPLREDKVKSDDWATSTELLVTNGPFAVRSITSNQIILDRSTQYNALTIKQAKDKYVKPARLVLHFGDEKEAIELYGSDNLAEKYFYLTNLSNEAYTQFASEVKTNSDLTTYTYFFNTNNELLSDAGTRKALSAALDRAEIAAIRGCGAEAATGLVPTGVREAGTKKEFRAVAGDVLTAIGEGAKVAKTGTIKLTYNADREYEKEIAEYAKKQWKSLGFTVELDGISAEAIDDVIKSGEYDVIAADYVSLTGDAYSILVPFAKEFSGSAVDVTTDVFFNAHFTGFENEQYNEIIEKLFTADKSTRATLMHDAEKLLLEEAPIAPLFFEKSVYVNNKDLSKFTVNYRGASIFQKAKLANHQQVNQAKTEAEEAAAEK